MDKSQISNKTTNNEVKSITYPRSQSGYAEPVGLYVALVLGLSINAYVGYVKYNENEDMKNQEAIAKQVANQNAIIATYRDMDARFPTLNIMHPAGLEELDTTVASVNIPIKTAQRLADQYGNANEPYNVSVNIPHLGTEHTVAVTPESGAWVQSLLTSDTINKTGIVPQEVYQHSINDLKKKLTSIKGGSFVKVNQNGVDATIRLPDAVALAIKNNKNNTSDEIKAALGTDSFNVAVMNVSTKSVTDTNGISRSNTTGKSTSLGGGVGFIIPPVAIGIGGMSDNSTSVTNGTNTGRAETTSAPNFVTGIHTINLSQEISRHGALLHSIISAQEVHVDPKFDLNEHKKIAENLATLEATENKLYGNKNPKNYADRAKNDINYIQPELKSEYNNLPNLNEQITSQTIIDAYGMNFDEVRIQIQEAEKTALKNGQVPVVVGVSYPDEIMKAQKESKSFDPSNPDHIIKAMGSADPFPITVNFGGKVVRATVTVDEFTKQLPQKVVGIIQSSLQEQKQAMAR